MASPRNVQVKREGDFMILKIDVSKKALDSAPLSGTGKSKLVASSGGWQSLDGNGLGYSLNVNYKG